MNPLDDPQQAILLRALDALRRTTAMAAEVLEPEPTTAQGLRGGTRVAVDANGQRYSYVAEIKRIDRFSTLGDIKIQHARFDEQRLLVAPRLTSEAAEKCRQLDLQFIDTLGNAYLHGPGLFVLVTGRRPAAGDDLQLSRDEGARTGTASNLRVFFALLCKPQLLNAPYRAIRQATGVALGAVGWAFADLSARGYITGTKGKGMGKGGRVLLEHQRLMADWVTNYPVKLRPKLNARRFHAANPDWWKEVDITQYGGQWGAEVAANTLTGYLRPHTLTIYLHKPQGQNNLTRLVAAARLRADPQGELEILDAFWDFNDASPMPETVPPLLVYADLIATLDPRNLEAAKLIHDRYLATTDGQA